MAQPVIKREGEKAFPRRTDRRQTPHSRLARLNRELRADLVQLRKKRVVGTGLVAASIVSAVVVIGALVHAAPRCDTSTTNSTILIGGAIKMAGC